MDVVVWLRGLGLGKYEAAFRENDIDETVLPGLTHETLKELGVVSIGHRVKLLDAIAALRSDASGKTQSVDATTTSGARTYPEDRAERRQVTVMFSRPGRLDGPLSAHGPRRPARGYFGLSEVRRRDCATLRRVRGEIYGRRRPDLLRLSASARGRRRAGGASGAGS